MNTLLYDQVLRSIRPSIWRRQRSSSRFLGAGAAVLAWLTVSPAAAVWVGEAEDLMGTRVSVELWHENEAQGEALVQLVLEEYRRIDEGMSTYKAESEISVLNRTAASGPVQVSEELYALIDRSMMLSRLSSGAFDITYESVGYLYDFRARQRPTEGEIDDRLDAVDYRHLILDPASRTIAFARPGVRINLGGIAKGYAVARGAMMLEAAGIEHALLNAGGDTRVLGDRRGQPWIVGIRHPRADDEVVTRLPLVDEAISTSGDYERFFEDAGRRYHHIINPTTGTPTEGVLSVTIIGPDATMTDGLSTALFVLGVDSGLAFIETLPLYEAIIVDATGRLLYSNGLAPPEG